MGLPLPGQGKKGSGRTGIPSSDLSGEQERTESNDTPRPAPRSPQRASGGLGAALPPAAPKPHPERPKAAKNASGGLGAALPGTRRQGSGLPVPGAPKEGALNPSSSPKKRSSLGQPSGLSAALPSVESEKDLVAVPEEESFEDLFSRDSDEGETQEEEDTHFLDDEEHDLSDLFNDSELFDEEDSTADTEMSSSGNSNEKEEESEEDEMDDESLRRMLFGESDDDEDEESDVESADQEVEIESPENDDEEEDDESLDFLFEDIEEGEEDDDEDAFQEDPHPSSWESLDGDEEGNEDVDNPADFDIDDDEDFDIDDDLIDDESEEEEEEEAPKKNKKRGKKPVSGSGLPAPLAKGFSSYYGWTKKLVGALARVPVLGKPFAMLLKAERVARFLIPLLPLLIPLLIWILVNSFYPSNSMSSDDFPDEGSVSAEVENYDSESKTASVSIENTGEVIMDVAADVEIYSTQLGLNPISWILPRSVTTCSTDWTLVEQGDIETVEAQCEVTDSGGFWFRGSVEEIRG